MRIVRRDVWQNDPKGLRSAVLLECGHSIEVVSPRSDGRIRYAWDGENSRGEISCPTCDPAPGKDGG